MRRIATKCCACHSRCPTPATRVERFHHLTQPWHAKWRLRSPKCCACNEKRTSSPENLAKVLRLSHRTTFDTNMLECHKAPHLPHETTVHDVWNLQKVIKSDHFCSNRYRHGHIGPSQRGRLRAVADGCEHKSSSVEGKQVHPQTPEVKRTLRYTATHSGKIRKAGKPLGQDRTK
jgi:hypothetical protein